MAIPVKFGDIGKSITDLLKPDYSPFSVEVNSLTVNAVKFTTTVKKSDFTKSDISGDLKAKYFDTKNGVTFNYSYNTDRKLVAKAEVSDSLVKGLRVDVEASIKAEKESASTKGVKLGLGYKQEHLNANASIDVNNSKIPIVADAVVSYDRLNLGGEVHYSLGSGSLTNYSIAASYGQPDYAIVVHASPDGKGRLDIATVTASYYHQMNNQLAAGAKLSYNLANANTQLTVGTAYALDASSSVKASLDTNGKVGLQYSQKLRSNIKATFGTTLNWSATPNVTADHGVSFVFDV